MEINAHLHLRPEQKLVMVPALQQSLKILQLSALELIALLRQEMMDNPVLEEVEDGVVEGSREEGNGEKEPEDIADKIEENLARLNIEWEEYFPEETEYSPEEEEKHAYRESLISRSPSLAEHLLWQLRISCKDEKQYKIGEVIIGHLDTNGYLATPLAEIAQNLEIGEEEVEEVLKLIQTFEPVGVGARSLQECLLIQVQQLGLNDFCLEEIIKFHLPDLEAKRYEQISQKLRIPISQVEKLSQVIASLEPRPGRNYGGQTPEYIIPDVFVEKVDNRYMVTVSDDDLPHLRISPFYRQLLAQRKQLSESTREYLRKKYQEALWLVKSLEQRRKTLLKVTESIFEVQREFLEKGVIHLKPLTLKEVANKVGLHESTVSRVTTNKYVQTPRGLFPLKYFFTRSLPTQTGADTSSRVVKKMIEELIQSEDANKPLSDQKITRLLQERGIKIARRTVTKYREELSLLPAYRRRSYSTVEKSGGNK